MLGAIDLKVLVTGSCGFIGTNLTESMLLNGHEVVGIDAFTNNYDSRQKRSNSNFLSKIGKFELIEEDLFLTDLDSLLSEIEVVFHLAGQPSVQNSWGVEFATYVERNILVTQRLLDAALRHEVRKFVYSSSSSVYGKVLTTPTKESDALLPVSPYGVTKLAAEHLTSLYGRELGLPTVSLRYFTVFGPKQRPDMAFHKMIRAGLEGTEFGLHGDGTQIRDFTYVGDIVSANVRAATADVDYGSVFNIGGGSPTTMSFAIKKIEELIDRPLLIAKEPFGKGNPMVTSADTTNARTLLGWLPETTFEVGLAKQVKWQKDFLKRVN